MFLPTGELRFASPTAEGMAVVLLRYRVEGAWIISDQPSTPKEERTAFRFDSDKLLVLTYAAGDAHFRRVG